MTPAWRRALLAGASAVVLGGMFEAGRLTSGSSKGWGGPASPSPPATPPGEVTLGAQAQRDVGLRVVTVSSGVVQAHLSATASVGADEQRSARLRTVGRGRVLTVTVRAGDAVTRGESLVTYDDLTFAGLRAQRASAAASLREAEAAAGAARDAYARGRALEGTVLAPAEVERRRAALAAAEATVASGHATMADLERRAALYTQAKGAGPGTASIVSPIDGFALTVGVSPGDLVDAGQEVATVADLADVWVTASVFQNDVARLDPNGNCLVSVPGLPGRVFEAGVGAIGHALDARTGAVAVRCVVDNPDRVLRIGMLAEAQLPTRQSHDALSVPAAAVQRIDGKPVVFVAEGDGTFHEQRIETGLQTPDRVVVTDGLHAGARVVTQGSFALKSQVLQAEISGD